MNEALGDGLWRHNFVNWHYFPDKLLVLFRREGLRAIRQSLLGLIVHFDNQTVSEIREFAPIISARQIEL